MSTSDFLNALLSFLTNDGKLTKEQIKYIYNNVCSTTSLVIKDDKKETIHIDTNNKRNHYLIRVGDGENFNNSALLNVWGSNYHNNSKSFITNVKPNDILWFVKANSKGLLIGVAVYQSYNLKANEPIANTNNNCGWSKYKDYSDNWDIIIHYTNLVKISDKNILSNIKGSTPIRKYKGRQTTNIDLESEYNSL